ncbi:RNA polymerase sigma factor [Bacillus methanolicus]|uniref:RNA polymerase sigma factor n=1 Tax=Bacillus methanolicus TaxID=1471 RepID=UPI0023805B94|nr:sigma factor [Bacillus methanolicus]
MNKEKKWIKLIQKKSDEKAVNELVSFYYQSIYAFVYKQTLNKELSMDLTQEIFISMLQSIQNFDEKNHHLRLGSIKLRPIAW